MKTRLTKRNILKFALAVIAFYALLAMNIFGVGEKIVPMQKDYLWLNPVEETGELASGDEYIQDVMQEIDTVQEAHQAAETTGTIDQIKFQQICNSNTIACNEIGFEGTYTDKDKYLYLGSTFKIINFLDNNLVTKQKVEDILRSIEITSDIGERRGYATHDTILLNVGSVADKGEFFELVSHEMGHILDLGILEGVGSIDDKNYTEFGNAVFAKDDVSLKFYATSRDSETIRKAKATKKDFCSGYGMSDPFEDFSECFNLYLNHNSLFKQIAKANKPLKQKYNFIAALFAGKYINDNKSNLTLIKNNLSRRPRDTTKIN